MKLPLWMAGRAAVYGVAAAGTLTTLLAAFWPFAAEYRYLPAFLPWVPALALAARPRVTWQAASAELQRLLHDSPAQPAALPPRHPFAVMVSAWMERGRHLLTTSSRHADD